MAFLAPQSGSRSCLYHSSGTQQCAIASLYPFYLSTLKCKKNCYTSLIFGRSPRECRTAEIRRELTPWACGSIPEARNTLRPAVLSTIRLYSEVQDFCVPQRLAWHARCLRLCWRSGELGGHDRTPNSDYFPLNHDLAVADLCEGALSCSMKPKPWAWTQDKNLCNSSESMRT